MNDNGDDNGDDHGNDHGNDQQYEDFAAWIDGDQTKGPTIMTSEIFATFSKRDHAVRLSVGGRGLAGFCFRPLDDSECNLKFIAEQINHFHDRAMEMMAREIETALANTSSELKPVAQSTPNAPNDILLNISDDPLCAMYYVVGENTVPGLIRDINAGVADRVKQTIKAALKPTPKPESETAEPETEPEPDEKQLEPHIVAVTDPHHEGCIIISQDGGGQVGGCLAGFRFWTTAESDPQEAAEAINASVKMLDSAIAGYEFANIAQVACNSPNGNLNDVIFINNHFGGTYDMHVKAVGQRDAIASEIIAATKKAYAKIMDARLNNAKIHTLDPAKELLSFDKEMHLSYHKVLMQMMDLFVPPMPDLPERLSCDEQSDLCGYCGGDPPVQPCCQCGRQFPTDVLKHDNVGEAQLCPSCWAEFKKEWDAENPAPLVDGQTQSPVHNYDEARRVSGVYHKISMPPDTPHPSFAADPSDNHNIIVTFPDGVSTGLDVAADERDNILERLNYIPGPPPEKILEDAQLGFELRAHVPANHELNMDSIRFDSANPPNIRIQCPLIETTDAPTNKKLARLIELPSGTIIADAERNTWVRVLGGLRVIMTNKTVRFEDIHTVPALFDDSALTTIIYRPTDETPDEPAG